MVQARQKCDASNGIINASNSWIATAYPVSSVKSRPSTASGEVQKGVLVEYTHVRAVHTYILQFVTLRAAVVQFCALWHFRDVPFERVATYRRNPELRISAGRVWLYLI